MSEYVLNIEYTFGPHDRSKTLPEGAFVCPINQYYLPKHAEVTGYELYDSYHISPLKDTFQYCYTRYGIIPIPDRLIRKVR